MLFSLDYHKFQKLFSSRQKRDRTRLALPRFCHFSGPPMQGYTRRDTYNQLQVRPDNSKQ